MDKSDPRRAPSDEELDELNKHWHDPGDPDGLIAEEERQQWQAQHPRPAEPATKRKKRHPFIKFLVLIVLLAAATYGAYWFGSNRAPSNNTPALTKNPAVQNKSGTAPVAPQTKHYDSTNLSIGLDYPSSWKLTDTTAKLIIASTPAQLTGVDGQKKSLQVLVTIQPKQSSIPGFPADGAYAELESDKLTYKQPTSIQRAQTYVSYLGYHKTNGLDAVYVTGDSGYMQDQLVPLSDITSSDPLIGISFATCSNSDCASGTVTPVTLLASSWEITTQSKQITALFESITLQ